MISSFTQIQHLSRNIKQRLIKVPVGVIGGYHGGNLGDMALGEAVLEQLDKQGIGGGLQTIYNLEKWPATPYAIMGGGASGYINSLRRIIKRYEGSFTRMGILGVDFPEESYPEDCLELIRNAAFVSCRSDDQMYYLKHLTSREQIYSHPDIAFSFSSDFCKKHRDHKKSAVTRQKILMVNVVALYAQIHDEILVPIESYRAVRPDLYENFQQMHNAYKALVLSHVEKALSEGYIVQTIPFTPSDAVFAKLLFKDLPVRHFNYTPNPGTMLKRMARADWVIATRLHATIFALKLGVKLTPIAYAEKNELLLQQLDVERTSYMSAGDLASGQYNIVEPMLMDNAVINLYETNSERAINACIEALNIKS